MRVTVGAFGLVLFPLLVQAQWEMQDSHVTADLRGVANVGGGVAWASGSHGTVLRTEDAGFVWQLCAVPPGAETLDFRGIQAFSNETAIAMSSGPGAQSRLYKTTDGCQTWTLLLTNPDKDGFWDAVRFEDAQRGRLLGDPVAGRFVRMDTFDGGAHWLALTTKDLAPPTPKSGAFAASNSSIDGATGSFVTGGPEGAWFYGADNTCTMGMSPAACLTGADLQHFTRVKLPLNGSSVAAGAFSLGTTADTSIVVGGDYTQPDLAAGTAAYFDRYLKGWFAAKTLPHGYRSAVAYDKASDTWITVGPNGTDVSHDGGRNWRALKPKPGEPANADQHWNALSLPYVVGPHGRIGKLRGDALKP